MVRDGEWLVALGLPAAEPALGPCGRLQAAHADHSPPGRKERTPEIAGLVEEGISPQLVTSFLCVFVEFPTGVFNQKPQFSFQPTPCLAGKQWSVGSREINLERHLVRSDS